MEDLEFYKNKIVEICKNQISNFEINKQFKYFEVQDIIGDKTKLNLNIIYNESKYSLQWKKLKSYNLPWINFHVAGILDNFIVISVDWRNYNKDKCPSDKTAVMLAGFPLDRDGNPKILLEENYHIESMNGI
ncbi:MAG: hypothetical protein JXB88_24580 [Spirochaetales bacterium]|nr:hypothetical protein [Spirochaetales bacterium]